MRIKPLLAAAAIAAALTLTACSSPSGTAGSGTSGAGGSTSSSAAPASTVKLTGSFVGENGKKAAGDVTISGDTITLSGFSSDQGPDLHLYLANGTTEDAIGSGTEIAPVAFDKASQTFTIPSGVDASTFTYLVEHCDKAKAVFGAAQLSK